MDARHFDPDAGTDVLIAGAGPAGCAAAIVCASAGLRTVLAERLAGPVARPGEALHPGAETVLARLLPGGFADAVGARHEGITVGWGTEPRFEPFGRDGNGPWRGFQVDRRRLDALLLDRARAAGAEVRLGCRVREPVVERGAVTGSDSTVRPRRCAPVPSSTPRAAPAG
ncbi:FAD-dependent monooxygenase [Streptomyces sp. MS1.HAVA.3]|uniref:FAD-dependent monooxygenase n=1 Tax=Streptomyces caledonius TaxID=3134107 RepID=A0ABU8TXU5_9ACTN